MTWEDACREFARILAPEDCEDLCARTLAESDLPDLVHAARSRVSSVGCVAGDPVHESLDGEWWDAPMVVLVEVARG